ncbi:hypothetical protein [Paraburkholderia haematera]|nr:hypothetical protein [Paraburkholderia haematera]
MNQPNQAVDHLAEAVRLSGVSDADIAHHFEISIEEVAAVRAAEQQRAE